MTMIHLESATALGASSVPFGLAGREPVNAATRAAAVAAVAARHADDVDARSRFPAEAIDSAREHGLLGMAVPVDLGGEGADIADIMEVCYRLGRACSSTAMIFAMHQIKVACIIDHGLASPWHQAMLRRLSADQLLMASSTTEGQNGGNVRSSAAAVETDGDTIRLDRAATVISYGAEADGIVTTARRSADAASSDQVLVVLLKDDYSLERLNGWDTLGMRGTCSAGFSLRAEAGAERVLPVGYDKIHAQTMTPVAHLLWSSVWSGIAAAAVERAQMFTRKASRGMGGQLPPGAMHFTRATSSLRTLCGLINSGLRRYQAARGDPAKLAAMDFQTTLTLLKVDASELAVATVMSALRACGLSGYRNDGDASVGRHLRDVLSSPLMINNDRILGNSALSSLMSTVPQSLVD